MRALSVTYAVTTAEVGHLCVLGNPEVFLGKYLGFLDLCPGWVFPFPPHPPGSSQSTEPSSLCYAAGIFAFCFTHGSVFILSLISQFIPPPIPRPHHVYTSVLYTCVRFQFFSKELESPVF